jgi:uncharacterized protein (TIGR03437 family)
MATGASADILRSHDSSGSPANVLASNRQFANSKNMALINAARFGAANPQAIPAAPSIEPRGIVPIFGSISIIQPGEWVSIYGSILAAGNALWNNDFASNLAGTSVTINGKDAYILYVSPGQINLQAPDDTATGTVPVVVTTAAGSATSTVTLNTYAPSFSLLDTAHVAGIIHRSNGSGAYGKGTYDILGPTGNSLGYFTIAAVPGDVVELYGVGFGPTTQFVPAGRPFSGEAPITGTFTLRINNVPVEPLFVGISSAGLYQINLVVPAGLGQGDVSIQASVGGMETQPGALFALEGPAVPGGPNTGGPAGSSPPIGSSFGPGWSGTGGFGSGGGEGGSGGGSGGGSARKPGHKGWHPKLRFPPKPAASN